MTDYELAVDARILVTGGTGFTGSNLLRTLARPGRKVLALARTSSDLSACGDLEIEWIRGELTDERQIRRAVQGVQYIFHMASPFRQARASDAAHYNIHVRSTRLLAEAALDENNFKRFVYVSTIGVHGHIEHPPADETAPLAPDDAYQRTKLEGEEYIRGVAVEKGLPLTVVRPTGIYGPGDRRFLKVFKWAARGWAPVIGDGSNWIHFIHVQDLCDFLILAAVHPAALGEVFICGSPSAVQFRDVIAMVGRFYGVEPRLVRFPVMPVFLLGDLCERVCRPLGIEPPIYRRRLAFYTKDRSFNTSKMKKLLGFVAPHSDEQGFKDLARWYLDHGWIKPPSKR